MKAVSDSGLELLKWLALVLMLGDHINSAFFGRELPVLTELSRICFPLFAMILGYNLARPGADKGRALKRLLLVALVSQLPHALALHYGVLPLNVLFTFALAVAVIDLVEKRHFMLAAIGFLSAGLFVDYAWPGVALVVSTWLGCRNSRVFSDFHPMAWLGVVASFMGLCLVNGNLYAWWALPVALAATSGQWPIPRKPWAFYVFYPVHLVVLAAAIAVF